MMLGHIGMAITVIGIAMVQNYSIERDVRLAPEKTSKSKGITSISKDYATTTDQTTMVISRILKSRKMVSLLTFFMQKSVSTTRQNP